MRPDRWARARQLGTATVLILCVFVVPIGAQNPPSLSPVERRAGFERGLQLWQASEGGLGTKADIDNAARWHLVAATGHLTANVPIQVEWVGAGAGRYHVKPNHQRVTFRADGGWTRELLHERILVDNGGESGRRPDHRAAERRRRRVEDARDR